MKSSGKPTNLNFYIKSKPWSIFQPWKILVLYLNSRSKNMIKKDISKHIIKIMPFYENNDALFVSKLMKMATKTYFKSN